MSWARVLLLGGIAGSTIFLGLPMGRMRSPAPRVRAMLNAVAIGILVFLLIEVFEHGISPVEDALDEASHHGGSWGHFAWLAALFTAALALGLMGLVYYDRWLATRPRAASLGPGAAAVEELRAHHRPIVITSGRELAFLVAVGIGLHNFSEGLAIGQSAAKGDVSLALLLIIGFGLHNATEGFGIVAPLAAEATMPSWGLLAVLGLIGGGPTFLGTVIGRSFVSATLAMTFLALAAGSILYVVVQLLTVAQRLGHKEMLMWGLLLGLLLGFGTDFVLVAAGV